MKRIHLLLAMFIVLYAVTDVSADIPALAYKLKPRVVAEVRFWWSLDEPTSTFHAQIHQESLWNPEAESYAGAKGLAQFMPSTADWISKLYPKALGENNPLDARWAIRALVIYDKWLYDRQTMDDRWEGTLSSYNGGLGNLRKEQAKADNEGYNSRLWWDNVELVSCRPGWAFKENRGYVRRILKILKPFYEENGF